MLRGFIHRAFLDRQARRVSFIALGIFLMALLVALGLWLGWPLALALGIGLAGWGAALFFRAREQSRDRQAQADVQSLRSELDRARQDEGRLEAVLRLNHSLAEAAADALDEHQLMDAALSAITGLVGALGCSFVPVDEWQQALPAFTYGQLPEPVLSAWSTHLATNMLRERCGSCQVLQSTPGACPLHPAQLGRTLTVYCLPVTGDLAAQPQAANEFEAPVNNPRTGRTTGVLHLYLPAGRSLDNETREFLDGLLKEIALAFESARLRGQEQVTLRQLQMLRAPENDFAASLGGLLDGLIQALEADFALIRLRPTGERLSSLSVERGKLSGMSPDEFGCLLDQVLSDALRGRSAASQPGKTPVWLSMPLVLPLEPGQMAEPHYPESSILGTLLVSVNRPHDFHPRQQVILQTVAAQVALLIENERLVRSLEYKVVIEERTRLAREIHDGLAQTLAFLKLQSAQMQSYLAQGDLTRLSQVLKDNYQALAEAYLDTRQAIDNLRLTPQEGLDHSLDRVLVDFENNTGLPVERSFKPLARPVAPEIQAQLVRIAQEALSNVRKHARARHVRCNLFERGGELILEISDDGLGFDAEDVPEISRHGLRGMRERAELIGADFQIISQARHGTTVRLALPASIEEETSP